MYNCDFRNDALYQSVVSFARGDVNGDRIPDNIYLMGVKTADSPFIQNITLIIQDGATGMFTSVPLKENMGYNPSLFLGDFTGNGVADIQIGIETGGSGGTIYSYIYSFINSIVRLMFDSDAYNEQYQYTVTYKDFYKVEVVSKINNKKYIIDISSRGADYLNEIYDRNGRLKNPISGFVDPLGGLYPVDFDSDRVYELVAFQKASGRYHADALGDIQNVLKWRNNMFVLDNQYLAIF